MSLVSQEEFVLHCSEVSTLHGPAERHSEEFKMSEKRLWLARINVVGKYDHVHVAGSVPCLENTKTTAHRIKHDLVAPARMYSEEYTAQLGTVKCFPIFYRGHAAAMPRKIAWRGATKKCSPDRALPESLHVECMYSCPPSTEGVDRGRVASTSTSTPPWDFERVAVFVAAEISDSRENGTRDPRPEKP